MKWGSSRNHCIKIVQGIPDEAATAVQHGITWIREAVHRQYECNYGYFISVNQDSKVQIRSAIRITMMHINSFFKINI